MKKIGIIGAMASEVETLKRHMQKKSRVEIASMVFEEGSLSGVDVVVVQSGVGKVNAAMCVQALVDRFGVTNIINTGAAGSLDAKINIGDIVLSKDLMYHDVDATNFGYALGEVPQMNTAAFPADEHMLEVTKRACEEINPELGVFVGRIVSGDQFICTQEKKDWIIGNFQGICCEMEGCAVAQACYLNKVPFLIIRSISDKADNSDAMDYPTFESQAAARSAKLTEYVLPLI